MIGGPSVLQFVKRTGPLVVMLIVLGLAFWFLDWRALVETASRMSISAVVASLAFCLLTHLLIALRWSMIATGQDAPGESGTSRAWNEFLVSLHASLFNLITPAALGADLHRIVAGKGREGGRAGSAGFILLERLLGILAQFAIFVGAYSIFRWGSGTNGGPLPPAFTWAATIFAVGSAAIFVGLVVIAPMAPMWLGERKQRGASVSLAMAEGVRTSGPRLIALMGLSFAAVASWVAASAPLAADAGLTTSLWGLAMIVVITEFARLMPISVQGIGIRESAFAVFSAQLGADAAAGFTVCALLYLLNYVVVAGLGASAGLLLQSAQRPS